MLMVLLLSPRMGKLWASWVLFFNTSDFSEVSWCLQCFPNVCFWDFILAVKAKAHRNHNVLELEHVQTIFFILQQCCLISSYKIILEREKISNKTTEYFCSGSYSIFLRDGLIFEIWLQAHCINRTHKLALQNQWEISETDFDSDKNFKQVKAQKQTVYLKSVSMQWNIPSHLFH